MMVLEVFSDNRLHPYPCSRNALSLSRQVTSAAVMFREVTSAPRRRTLCTKESVDMQSALYAGVCVLSDICTYINLYASRENVS
jgi:hypothetical protein